MRTLLPPVVAFLCLSLACAGDPPATSAEAPEVVAPTPPTPGEPELHTAWMVILSGATDEASGKRDLETVLAKGIARQGGHPRLVHSDEVEGLKPGFWISVGATVDDEATATSIVDAVRPRYDGAYVREVRVAELETIRCPADLRCRPMRAPAWRAIVVFDILEGEKGEDWAWFTDEVSRKSKAYGVPAYWAQGTEARVEAEGRTEVVDLSPFAGELFGYVFVEEGKEPEYCPHLPAELVLSAASDYFTFDLLHD
ncbi:MAG: hypothetical protein EP330_16765 [Deltaproteobacteria bacterium]|nr:MAG: hypothetical protein EP330_16765 [Deltaproteobacteria bacterium]